MLWVLKSHSLYNFAENAEAHLACFKCFSNFVFSTSFFACLTHYRFKVKTINWNTSISRLLEITCYLVLEKSLVVAYMYVTRKTVIMMTSSNGNISALLAICAGNSPFPGEFPSQRPVTRSFDVFFDLRLNKRLHREAGDFRRYRVHYDVTVMNSNLLKWNETIIRYIIIIFILASEVLPFSIISVIKVTV